MDSIVAKLEGLVEHGKLSEIKAFVAMYKSEIPEGMLEALDLAVFERNMERAAIAKQNGKVTQAHARVLFHQLFKKEVAL